MQIYTVHVARHGLATCALVKVVLPRVCSLFLHDWGSVCDCGVSTLGMLVNLSNNNSLDRTLVMLTLTMTHVHSVFSWLFLLEKNDQIPPCQTPDVKSWG